MCRKVINFTSVSLVSTGFLCCNLCLVLQSRAKVPFNSNARVISPCVFSRATFYLFLPVSEAVYTRFEQLRNGFLGTLNLEPLPGTFLGY